MKKYNTGGYDTLIKEVEVISETKCFVRVQCVGSVCRESKRSDYTNYFDTWEEAKQFLLENAQARVDALEERLSEAEQKLATIIELKPPDVGRSSQKKRSKS